MTVATEIRDANAFAGEHQATWTDERKAIARRIANDRQAIAAVIDGVLAAWDRDGLLERNTIGQPHRGKHTRDIAIGHWLRCIDDTLGDALSALALEAIDVAETAQ